jgi:serine/threonine-protein kinase
MSANLVGQKIGQFRIESQLGAGAMGVVYLGTSEKDGRKAALKVISAEQLAKGTAFERFEREVTILKKFRHPNIVKYYGDNLDKNTKTFCFVMEYIQGTTLEQVLKTRGFMPWPEVVRYAIQLCEALDYAHQHNVVHRDLKPANIMIATNTDQLKLTDFGIAKALDLTGLTAEGRTLGTGAYMAPEQIDGKQEISHKTDIYTLGVVLFQMLCGDIPFRGNTIATLMNCHLNILAPKASTKSEQNLPIALDELIFQMMEKRPGLRPFDCAKIAMDLKSIWDRYEAGERLPMVHPEEGTPEANPTRTMMATAPSTSGTTPASKKTGKKKKKKGGVKIADLLPTIGLLSGLVLVGGAIGYVLWPASAKYLVTSAEPLMNSDKREDWGLAQSMYLDELERRFPDHDFKAQTDAWYDKIELARIEGRADVLERSTVPGFSKAKDDDQGEQIFTAIFPAIKAAMERRDELDAVKRFTDMSVTLEKSGSKKARGWILFANKRAKLIEDRIEARKKEVASLLEKAIEADLKHLPEEALNTRKSIIKQFKDYSDQSETIKRLRELVPDSSKEDGPKP